MPASRPERRIAFTLTEVLVLLGVLMLVVGPALTIHLSSQRIAHGARRQTEVTLHAQTILETLAVLSAEDFPAVDSGGTVLLDDSGPAATGGGPAFEQIAAFFRKPPPFEMHRMVTATRLPTGQLLLKLEVRWMAVVGETRTEQTLTLPMLANPKNWQ
jgi:hypothetical protein